MSLPSGTPSSRRTTTSHSTLVTTDCASASTMNMTIVARNMKRRPMRSVSQPPISAPITAPPWVPAPARPSNQGSGLYFSLMKISTKAIE